MLEKTLVDFSFLKNYSRCVVVNFEDSYLKCYYFKMFHPDNLLHGKALRLIENVQWIPWICSYPKDMPYYGLGVTSFEGNSQWIYYKRND